MIIISHRGYWKEPIEKNQQVAFKRSFNLGFGTETDVRDSCSKLVIAHDCPQGDEMIFDELLEIMAGRNLPLAINIKADGLAGVIQTTLKKYNHTNYFCFDMSIPDMVVQLKQGLCVYTGFSDIQPTPVLLAKSEGIWLDSFEKNWWSPALVDKLLQQHKVCIVSDELHQRDTTLQWNLIKQIKNRHSDKLMLCTDNPEQATTYFEQ